MMNHLAFFLSELSFRHGLPSSGIEVMKQTAQEESLLYTIREYWFITSDPDFSVRLLFCFGTIYDIVCDTCSFFFLTLGKINPFLKVSGGCIKLINVA